MAVEVPMPRLSDTMEQGTVARWVKHEGDHVVAGDVIAEIDTDKATMELTAYDDGVLLKILVGEGESADLGTPIALIGAEGEEVPETAARGNGPSQAATRRGSSPRSRADPRPDNASLLQPEPREPPDPQVVGEAAGEVRPARSRAASQPRPGSTCVSWPARAAALTVASSRSTSSVRLARRVDLAEPLPSRRSPNARRRRALRRRPRRRLSTQRRCSAPWRAA